MKNIKVAVIGVGYFGSIHARIYSKLKNVELYGVVDIDEKKACHIAKKYNTRYFTHYSAILDKVDAVSVVVPTELHYPISKDLLNHNLHLLIEKPITDSVEDADELLKIAKKKNVILQVGHVERFNCAFMAVKNLIKAPRFIECHRLGPYQPRATNVGVVLDLMIHDIDIILGAVKEKVVNVDAVGVPVLSKTDDIANARILFENGTVCNLTCSRVTNKKMRKIRIFQEDTYISLDYFKQSVQLYRKTDNRILKEKIKVIKKEEPLKTEISSFINCVISKERPLVSGLEGRNALAIALEIENKIIEYKKRYLKEKRFFLNVGR